MSNEKGKSGLRAAEEEINYWEKLENHYRDLYNTQVESNNSAAAEATERTLQQIGQQIDALNAQFRENNRALYRGFRDAARKLPQQLAAEGITGGLSESSHVKLRSDYEQKQSEAETERANSEAALRRKALESEQDNLTQAKKSNAAALQSYRNNQLSVEKEKRNEADERAKLGDFSLYEELGYSDEEIQSLRQGWEEKNPKLAMAVAARNESYSAEDAAGLPAHLVQYYLQALGYKLKNNGVWDADTEKAFKAYFGVKSGRR